MNDSAMAALLVWTGLHVILMLALALNVSRHRFQSDKDEDYDERRLVKAIRAHGNNIEYVPIILFCIALLGRGWGRPPSGFMPFAPPCSSPACSMRTAYSSSPTLPKSQGDWKFRHLGGHAGHRDCARLPGPRTASTERRPSRAARNGSARHPCAVNPS